MSQPSKLYRFGKTAGVSRYHVEKLWVLAKRFSEGKGNAYALDLVRRMLRLESRPSLVEGLIEEVSEGLGMDTQVRSFFTSGNLCFASPDDTLIEAGADPRIDILCAIVNENEWPAAHEIWDACDNYVGSLQELFEKVLGMLNLGVA